MNREVEFRGKRLDNNEWLHGDLMHDNQGGCYIYPLDAENLYVENKVDKDTVGQFTGMTDKHGVKIFEGDIVCKRDLTFNLQYKGVVVYNSAIGCFRIHIEGESKGTTMRMGFEASDVYDDGKCTVPVKYDYEVIGNIHDNSELLATK